MCVDDPLKPHWAYCDSRDCCKGYNPVPASGFTMEQAREIDRYEEEQRRMAEVVSNAKKNLQNKTENDLVPFLDTALGEPYAASPNKDDDMAEPSNLRGKPLYKTLTLGGTTYKIGPGEVEVSYDEDPELTLNAKKYVSFLSRAAREDLDAIMTLDTSQDFGTLLNALNEATITPTGVTKWPIADPETSSADGDKPEVKPNFQNLQPYDVEDDASVRDVIEVLYKHWSYLEKSQPGGRNLFGNYKKLSETMLEVLTLLDTENVE